MVDEAFARSYLSVPASSERMLEKAFSAGADAVVLDLEDAVAPAQKDAARELAARTLADPRRAGLRLLVRVNGAGTPWSHRDLIALAALEAPPEAIVIPKVESAHDLAYVDRLLDGVQREAGRTVPIAVHALIESAAGLAAAGAIAAASRRLEALILGYADLAASLGRTAPALDDWRPAQDAVLVAARGNGLQAVDGPYLRVEVDDDFTAAVDRARTLGYDGKWAIHPRQLAALNATFSPSDDEIARARAVIAALHAAERASGAGATALDGQMLDEALRVSALRVLARARGSVPSI
jgi:citrate lyase subunit beta/citryl-CoA lyase